MEGAKGTVKIQNSFEGLQVHPKKSSSLLNVHSPPAWGELNPSHFGSTVSNLDF